MTETTADSQKRADYRSKIAAMSDSQLTGEAASKIHGAAVANCHRTGWQWDVHWQVEECYEEAMRRDKSGTLYDRAYEEANR